jgi:hypothetical protein
MNVVQEDLSSWDLHVDGTGRAFIANRATCETRWVWQKWAVNGRVFCLNVLTQERVWQDDMSPELRIAAGIPPPPPLPVPATAAQYAAKRTHVPMTSRGPYDARHLKRSRLDSSDLVASVPILRSAPNPLRHDNADKKPSSYSPFVEHVANATKKSVPRKPIVRNELLSKSALHGPPSSSQLSTYPPLNRTTSSPSFSKQSRLATSGGAARVSAVFGVSNESRASRFQSVSTPPLPPVRRRIPSLEAVEKVTPARRRDSTYTPIGRAATEILVGIRTVVVDQIRLALIYERDYAIDVPSADDSDMFADSHSGMNPRILEGTCDVVPKLFLRLTSAPKPSEVRPLAVLKRALKLVKTCWRNQEHDYEWTCSQLKSIRQDLKVQHIETNETLDTYETHARIALENEDFGELNTCLAQLSELYARVERTPSVRDEFASYRVLYNLLVGANQAEYARMLQSTTREERSRPALSFAMKVRNAVLDGNYNLFFALYSKPPPRSMATYLMDPMVDSIRSRAICTMCHAYSPGSIPLSVVVSELDWCARGVQDEAGFVEDPLGMDREICLISGSGNRARKGDVVSFPVDIVEVRAFCEDIGAVIESSGKDEPMPFVLNAKASKLNGVRAKDSRRGLITAAGAR